MRRHVSDLQYLPGSRMPLSNAVLTIRSCGCCGSDTLPIQPSFFYAAEAAKVALGNRCRQNRPTLLAPPWFARRTNRPRRHIQGATFAAAVTDRLVRSVGAIVEPVGKRLWSDG